MARIYPSKIRSIQLPNVSMPNSGNCGFCGEWDSELKNGFCRDKDCSHARRLEACRQGKAIYYFEDAGRPGIKIVGR
jgi:hypothetical protein